MEIFHRGEAEPDRRRPIAILANEVLATANRRAPKASKRSRFMAEEGDGAELEAKQGQSRYILLLPATTAICNIQTTFAIRAPRRSNQRHSADIFFAIQPSKIIIDEVHRIKGRNTLVWKLVRRCQRRATSPMYLLAMSGTPITRDPGDLSGLVESLCIFFN